VKVLTHQTHAKMCARSSAAIFEFNMSTAVVYFGHINRPTAFIVVTAHFFSFKSIV